MQASFMYIPYLKKLEYYKACLHIFYLHVVTRFCSFINDVYRFQDMKTMTASKHFSTIINNSGLKPTQYSKIRKVYLKIFHGCVEGDVNGEGGGIMVWA